MSRIEKLTKQEATRKLGDYLTLKQIDGLMTRRQLLLDLVAKNVKQYGENAVYFP
jgi:hypothetical protein